MRSKNWLKVVGVGLVLTMGAIARGAGEPNSVGEILKGNKLDWIVGEWMGQADANAKAKVEYELEIDGYALSIEAHMGKSEFTGLAYYAASKNTIIFMGVNNGGQSYVGSWMVDGDKLLVKMEITGRDGSIKNFDRSLSKVDDNTMKWVTYSVVEGKRSDDPIGVLEFKRKKAN